VSSTPQDVWSQIDTSDASATPKDVWAELDHPTVAGAKPKPITPFFTQLGHAGEDIAGGVVHSVGNLVDIATGTAPGAGSHAATWSAPFQHEPDNTGEPPDIKEQVRQGLPKIDPYNLLPKGPLQDTVRMYAPQAMEGIATVAPVAGEVGGAITGSMERRAASALEQDHPLTAAAQSEADKMHGYSQQAENAGIELPPREVSKPQQYINGLARDDMQLPKNAPITDGMIDSAQKKYVSPGYEAAKATPEYQLGPKYQKAISGIDTDQIDAKWRPPADGTMDGTTAVKLSSQLRSVARGLYEDSGNMNLTSVDRSAAREAADAHYQAAKAVEGGFREGAQARDAAQSAAGTPTTAGTDVADAWDKARVYKAKSEAWRDSLDGAGNVIGPKVKKMMGDESSDAIKAVGNTVAQYPELFRSTRLQTPQEGVVKKGVRAVAPMAGAAIGEAIAPGGLGAASGAAVGKYGVNRFLGPG
jgi:hypothetical protein